MPNQTSTNLYSCSIYTFPLVKLVQGYKISSPPPPQGSPTFPSPRLPIPPTSLMAAEPVECQVLVLRVSIHCEGCKKKVKKVLQHVDGVFRCDIDGRRNRVTVTASKKIDAGVLVARLRKSGKLAEPWPEEPKQQEEQPAESQNQDTKNQANDASKPSEAAEKPATDAAAEPSNAQTPAPEPEKTTEETPPPPAQEKKEADETKTETAQQQQQQPNEATGKANQQQQHDVHEKPIDAKVTMVFDDVRGSRGVYGYGSQYQNYMPATRQPPVHVMSYNQARPMASSSYYAAAPMPTPAPAAQMPMPMPRSGPPQGGYIDEYAPPNYYGRPAPPSYEPYSYYADPQPSPYRHQRSAADDDYYYGAPSLPPQRSAFSPPREAYGDMFNDENANSCSVM
uniref:Uncharacterized protein n=1 Tax=Avena sativa TaxID=4498 RepID=A0ACD5XB57_AVESA